MRTRPATPSRPQCCRSPTSNPPWAAELSGPRLEVSAAAEVPAAEPAAEVAAHVAAAEVPAAEVTGLPAVVPVRHARRHRPAEQRPDQEARQQPAPVAAEEPAGARGVARPRLPVRHALPAPDDLARLRIVAALDPLRVGLACGHRTLAAIGR